MQGVLLVGKIYCSVFGVIHRGRPFTWSVTGGGGWGLCFWVRCDYGFNKMRLFHGDMMTPEGLSVETILMGLYQVVWDDIGSDEYDGADWRHTRGMLSLKHQTHERQCVGISKHGKRVENVTKFDKIWGISQAFDISSQSKQKGRSKQRSKTSFTVVFVVTWRIINKFEKSSIIYINSILAWVGDSCTVSYCIALLRNKVVIGRMQLFLSEALQMLK